MACEGLAAWNIEWYPLSWWRGGENTLWNIKKGVKVPPWKISGALHVHLALCLKRIKNNEAEPVQQGGKFLVACEERNAVVILTQCGLKLRHLYSRRMWWGGGGGGRGIIRILTWPRLSENSGQLHALSNSSFRNTKDFLKKKENKKKKVPSTHHRSRKITTSIHIVV